MRSKIVASMHFLHSRNIPDRILKVIDRLAIWKSQWLWKMLWKFTTQWEHASYVYKHIERNLIYLRNQRHTARSWHVCSGDWRSIEFESIEFSWTSNYKILQPKRKKKIVKTGFFFLLQINGMDHFPRLTIQLDHFLLPVFKPSYNKSNVKIGHSQRRKKISSNL